MISKYCFPTLRRQRNLTRFSTPCRENDLAVGVETMEPRRMLAGNVDVTAVAGHLIVIGDAQANDILIEQTGANQIRVSSGFDVTNVNGGSGPVTLGGITGDIRFEMQDGSDIVSIDGVTVERDVRFQGGDGDNTFLLSDSQVNRHVQVNNHTGLDDVGIQNSLISGNLRVVNRNGGSYTALNGTDVMGNLLVDNRDGLDYLFVASGSSISGMIRHRSRDGESLTGIFDSEVKKRTTIVGGDSADDLLISTSSISGDMRFVGRGADDRVDSYDSVFDAKATILMGAGYDDVYLGKYSEFRGDLTVRSSDTLVLTLLQTSIDGNSVITTGTGDDHFEIDDVTFGGRFRLASGAGDDNIDLEESVTAGGVPTRFMSNAVFNLGGGDDVIEVGISSDPALSAEFDASIVYRGGTGDDWLDHLTQGNIYAILPTVIGFELET